MTSFTTTIAIPVPPVFIGFHIASSCSLDSTALGATDPSMLRSVQTEQQELGLVTSLVSPFDRLRSSAYGMIAYVDMLGSFVKLRGTYPTRLDLIVFIQLDCIIAFHFVKLAWKVLWPTRFWTASVSAMYSASVDDNAIVRCFFSSS